MNKIEAKRIKTFKLVKYIIAGNFLIFVIPFLLLAINSAISDNSSMYFNGHKLGPIEGIVFAPFLTLLFAASVGITNWVFIAIGLKVWSIFRPIELEYEEHKQSSN